MKTIHKFPLNLFDQSSKLAIPVGSRFLHVGRDPRALPSMWFEVPADPNTPKVEQTFYLVGTGREVPKDGRYLATINDGPFVWHIYVEEGV
jgi:hypothetical protein